MPAEFGTQEHGHHGLALGDVNGDGLDDVYLCAPAGLPNRLFIQNEDGTASDAAGRAGVDWLDDSRAALLVDLENDGDQDLVLAMRQRLLLMSNDGQGGNDSTEGVTAHPPLVSIAVLGEKVKPCP